jgi:acetoin utilization protein AcuB
VPVERLLSELRLRDVMSAPAISVGLDTEVEEAARVMAEEKLGSLPVVDRGRIVGIVTETDLLRRIIGADAGAKGGVDIRCAITVSRRV